MSRSQVLLCSVGTGNADQLRESLLIPLTKSIQQGEWEQVILLPSQHTAANARTLRDELQAVAIEIKELPQAGQEDDADACFAHFDRVIEQLRSHWEPHQILVDFTRGTKAMSAALVLAAVRHELPRLRYVTGQKTDKGGTVIPGTEVVKDVSTTQATARRRLDEALSFMQRGNFAAVLEILPSPDNPFAAAWPRELLEVAKQVRPIAQFYAAWDRLDYKSASQQELPPIDAVPILWRSVVPQPETQAWVNRLAEPLPTDAKQQAPRLRCLAADLLANGERRLRDQHFEDTVLRAYRVLELVGQFRLCDLGIKSDDIPVDHPVVREFMDRLQKKRSTPLSTIRGGRQTVAAREQVARLLKSFNDRLADKLLKYGEEGVVSASSRNLSALIHGFEATGGDNPVPLAELLNKLDGLLREDSPTAADSLHLSRSMCGQQY